MTGYAIKMTILITAMTVCIGLNTERVIGHQTGHPRESVEELETNLKGGHEKTISFVQNLHKLLAAVR